MTETTNGPDAPEDGDGDELRRHTEAATEGNDGTDGAPVPGEPVPREHSEDPAEG